MEINIGLFIIFLVIWFSIYGGLHYYVYRKFVQLLPSHKKGLISVLVLLAGSLLIAELLTHNGYVRLAYPVAGIAYSWMGLVFLFFFLSATIDVITRIANSAGIKAVYQPLVSNRRTVVVSVVVAVLGLYGYSEVKKVNVEIVDLQSKKLSHSLRIVQVSDLHLGILSSKKDILKLTEMVNGLHADIIVSTGDLVDMQLDHVKELAEQLSSMNATIAKYAVYGNHEAFAGLQQAQEIIDVAGFSLLSNTGVTLDSGISIVGIDDPAITRGAQNSNVDEKSIVSSFPAGSYTVLLKHQPVIDQASVPYFDLQLSGHTHGGQIFPFGLLTRLVYPIGFGLVELDDTTWVYVSRGTGTWGPPMRIFAGPEVTLFRISPKT